MTSDTDQLLSIAGERAGLISKPAQLIREGSHALFTVPNGVVARVGPPGSEENARQELRVASWLREAGIVAVEPVPGLVQPTLVGNRPVTWWVELPPHRAATPSELGLVLKHLHQLPRPAMPGLPLLDPFAGFEKRIQQSGWPVNGGLAWLMQRLADLQQQWEELPGEGIPSVIHGDAWQGNVAVAGDGTPTLVDLEHVSLGPREWDLAPLAVDYTDFQRISDEEYNSFVEAYGGYDVTEWVGYRTLADIQELRWVCFALGRSSSDPQAATEARHRIACLRGEIPRPWTWAAL